MARREKCDDGELSLMKKLASLYGGHTVAEPYRVVLKPRVVLEAPRASLMSQYLFGTRPSKDHVTLDVTMFGKDNQEISVKALVDCGASNIFVSPRIVKKLRLVDRARPAHVTTFGLNGQVIAHARDSKRVDLSMRYFEHLAPVVETDVLCVPLETYDLVLGLPWFRARTPHIDWIHNKVLELRTPGGRTETSSSGDNRPASDCEMRDSVPVHRERGQGRPGPDIQLMTAESMSDLLESNEEVADVFYMKMEHIGLLLGARTNVGTWWSYVVSRSSGGSCGRRPTTRCGGVE